jgi:thioester reductase-like protein
MAIFVTGATGYIGGYIVAELLEGSAAPLNLLVRARGAHEAEERLWRALQLHFDFPSFHRYLASRIRIFRGDLTGEHFGLDDGAYQELAEATDSVIHCAASLNRKSEKVCLNVNLRGTLEVVQLARSAQNAHGLRRFSHVSTVAVAGTRSNEIVTEDAAIDWNRSDYDPYARTKKFCEHMVRRLLPDVPHTIFRPSIVLGDSRRAETTQFEMVRAFAFLAGSPILPFRPTDKIDVVPVDYVAKAVAVLHQKENPAHDVYHLSSGAASQTFRELTDALSASRATRKPVYWPGLEKAFGGTVDWLAHSGGDVGKAASLMKVFWPYLVWNTVFDNTRVIAEIGRAPAKFSEYSAPLLRFSREHRFSFPYDPWPLVEEPARTVGASARIASR